MGADVSWVVSDGEGCMGVRWVAKPVVKHMACLVVKLMFKLLAVLANRQMVRSLSTLVR
jgi:hypothetical protein